MYSDPLSTVLAAILNAFLGTAQLVKPAFAEVFGPFLTYGPPVQSSIDIPAFAAAKSLITNREGIHNPAGNDSKGILTVGIGHKVVPGDHIVYGQTVTQAQIDAWFNADIAKAFTAAKSQAKTLGKYTVPMIAALTAVNFQLGIGWTSTFYNTWASLKSGNVQDAINRLKVSDWNSQTPVRVADFIQTIQSQFG